MNNDQRDEDTFGAFTSQNFKFNHEAPGEKKPRTNQRERGPRDTNIDEAFNQKGRMGNSYKLSQSEQVVEDGHKDFFDTKKKGNQAGRAKNRFAGINDKDSNGSDK